MAPVKEAANTNFNHKKHANKKLKRGKKNMAPQPLFTGNVLKKKAVIKPKKMTPQPLCMGNAQKQKAPQPLLKGNVQNFKNKIVEHTGGKDFKKAKKIYSMKKIVKKTGIPHLKGFEVMKMMDMGPSISAGDTFSALSGLPYNMEGNAEESNSKKDGRDAFTWLIAPVTLERFYKYCWERTPLHVKRSDFPDYYKEVLTTEKINEILQNNLVLFSKNIDVTSYRDGKRETHNPSGRATPAVVWDFYQKGCSVRMLNPQTFSPELLKLNSTLQEFFGCFVGANSYLTPAISQGFAPHYDDIEAFILQIEGKKHWRVYGPRKVEDFLPRFSSENLSQDGLGEPVLEVILEPGDLLYIPRGFVHQANTLSDHHSLHVTISCYQRNTWADFLEKLLPAALSQAVEEDVELRRGLPVGYLSHVGVCHSEAHSEQRLEFYKHIQKLMIKVLKHAPIDATADQMGKQFMHDALPPVLTRDEEQCTIFSRDNLRINEGGVATGSIALCADTHVKLLRAHALRMVKEDPDSDNVHVYHCIDNSLEFHGEEPQSFEVPADFALAMEHLIHSYPKFVIISSLPLETEQEKLELANLLWKKGLLITSKPLGKKK